MENDSNIEALHHMIARCAKESPSKYWAIMENFLKTYRSIIEKKGLDFSRYVPFLITFAKLAIKQMNDPAKFEPYHTAIREPIDYYQLGIDIFRPLIDLKHSTFKGKENLHKIQEYIKRGENVYLFANHQTEADPQALSLLIEKEFPELAQDIIFVAGERVVTDPLAVPFSLGLNLFCIYSKRYFDLHIERKTQMLEHNKQTMMVMRDHLSEGAKCICVFPSGGRDRRDSQGLLPVAPFDPQSTELMYLLGRKSKRPTHYFPLALSTHDILPPPREVQRDLGESRPANEAPIHIAFGKEIDMENFPLSDTIDKEARKQARAQYVWQMVADMYNQFPA